MALSKDKKTQIFDEVKGIVKDSGSVTFVNFHGVNVEEANAMRKALRDKGVSYRVAKKTIASKALENSSVEGEVPSLEGELALAYSEDILDSAREVYEFQKQFEDRISIMGGIFDGVYKNKEEMTEIAEIPSQETLRAQFVNVINSPIQGFVVALNQIAEAK